MKLLEFFITFKIENEPNNKIQKLKMFSPSRNCSLVKSVFVYDNIFSSLFSRYFYMDVNYFKMIILFIIHENK